MRNLSVFNNFPSLFSEEGVFLSPWKTTDKAYQTEVDLPGVSKEEIDIKLSNGLLEIVASTSEKNKTSKTSRNYYKSMSVPDGVDTSNIKASFENGVLLISLPFSEKQVDLKKIQIE